MNKERRNEGTKERGNEGTRERRNEGTKDRNAGQGQGTGNEARETLWPHPNSVT